MDKRRIILIIFLVFCFGRISEIKADSYIEHLIFSNEEIDILNLAINDIINDSFVLNIYTILINRYIDTSRLTRTLPPALLQNRKEYREEYLKDVSDELWQSLQSYNSRRFIMDYKTKFNVKNYKLVNINDDDYFIEGKPSPLLSFTRIGFNNDKTEALLEVNYYFPRAGSGHVIHLQKENNVWKIINKVITWVS